MATVNHVEYIDIDGSPMTSRILQYTSQSNRKPNGKVDTSVQSPYNLRRANVRSWYSTGLNPATKKRQPPMGALFSPFSDYPSDRWTRHEQTALAKFRGKIRKGNASLGITLATLSQTRDMFHGRLDAFRDGIVRASDYLSTKKGRKRLKSRIRQVAKKRGELTAGHVLEGFFGWAPLVSDVRALMFTLFQQGIPPQFVKGSHRFTDTYSTGAPGGELRKHSLNGRVTIAATVQITNPNLWLASRAGVLNPLVVAWDLVPWSWLVNMFVNVNSLLSASTDYAGLSFSRQSVTKTGIMVSSQDAVGYGGTRYGCQVFSKGRVRTVGSIPQTTLQFRVPELDVSLGLIASALIVQKARKISSIINLLSK